MKELGEVYQNLYYMRRKVDYGGGVDSFDIESLGNYLSFVREVFEIVESRVDI